MNEKRLKDAAVRYFGVRAGHWDLSDLGRRLELDGFCPRSFLAFAHREYGSEAYQNQVAGDRVYALFEARQPVMEAEAELTTEIDFKTYEARRAAGFTPRQLLSDDNLAVSPMFKYVFSMVEGFYDLAARLGSDAQSQVMENPYYVANWPEDLLIYFPRVEEE